MSITLFRSWTFRIPLVPHLTRVTTSSRVRLLRLPLQSRIPPRCLLSCSFTMGSKNSIYPPSDEDSATSRVVHSDLVEKARERPREMSEDDWRKVLSPRRFHVTRMHGTERAFTGELYHHKDTGDYLCACCSVELFESSAKFDSGSGWPSFYETKKKVGENYVYEKHDDSLGMRRTEVLCKRCGAHLGHVFNDGPKPTGMRYCINSASLRFKSKEEDSK